MGLERLFLRARPGIPGANHRPPLFPVTCGLIGSPDKVQRDSRQPIGNSA
jgi:hypothetical protein